MKALVKFAPGREGMGVREVPEPSPAAGQLKIEVAAAGICGSDIHTMNDERKANMPVVMGHEFVGRVSELGAGVTDFKPGDWVVAIPAVGGCGKCDFCLNGEVTMCDSRASIGTHIDGAMAKYVVLPAKFAFHLPDGIEDKLPYAAAEPFCCCIHGVMERMTVHPGDVTLISGPGLMGQCCMQVLKYCGAKVVMSGLAQDMPRLQLALEKGADAIATTPEELEHAVRSLNPKGADIAIECATVAPSSAACIRMLRKQGTYLQIGVFSRDVPMDMGEVLHKELTVTGSNSSTVSSWKTLLKMIDAGYVDLAPLITAEFPLEDWEKGFELTMSKTAYKVLLIP